MSLKQLGTDGKPIPIVDIFAGPGGLGEGFSQAGESKLFRNVLSIEMEGNAHRTLRLRAFQRKLAVGDRLPKTLLAVVKGEEPDEAIAQDFPEMWREVEGEVLRLELGAQNANAFRALSNNVPQSCLKDGRWILVGGPPCQAFSLAGRARKSRDRIAGRYRPEADERHFLYRQYLEILGRFRPAVFVMENVKGVLSARVNGVSVFENILEDLRQPNRMTGRRNDLRYRLYSVSTLLESGAPDLTPKSFIVKSELYGVPQRRHRVIIVGIRTDYQHEPSMLLLNNNNFITTCREAIGDLPVLRSRLSRRSDSMEEWCSVIRGANWRHLIGIGERGRIPESNREIFMAVQGACEKLVGDNVGGSAMVAMDRQVNAALADWYEAEGSPYVFNHESRFHMDEDLWRYLYMAARAELDGETPKLSGLPKPLLPNHGNVEKSVKSNALFNDRFRVQIAGEPSTTVTSHISKDGHGFIHYDPTQCRTMTVREVARLQTFPDDYCFLGTRTAQYRQVGNAVPPYLAYQIAEAVASAMGLT